MQRKQHQIRLSDAELAAFEQVAAKDGRKWSEWLREIGRREAGMGTKTYSVQLVKGGDIVETEFVGDFGGLDAAMAAAKKAAGRGAEYVTKGVDRGYAGPSGIAYVTE
jgi:hypothetical protein